MMLPQRRRGRVTYRMLKRQFELDDASEDLKAEILYSQSHIVDDEGQGFAWTDGTEPGAVQRFTHELAFQQTET